MRCMICGTELKDCSCPICGFDRSKFREIYPTLFDDGNQPEALWASLRCQFNQARSTPFASAWEKKVSFDPARDLRAGFWTDGNNGSGQHNTDNRIKRITISAGAAHTVGLCADGTAVDTEKVRNVDWTDLVAISAGNYHTVGLHADGTAIATGRNGFGQCEVGKWTDLVAISAGGEHTVGLCSDGTAVAVGNNHNCQCNVKDWRKIMAISTGRFHTVGLRADGTAVAIGSNSYGQCNVGAWKNLAAISAGYYHTVGLCADGTVVATGYNRNGCCNVTDWKLALP